MYTWGWLSHLEPDCWDWSNFDGLDCCYCVNGLDLLHGSEDRKASPSVWARYQQQFAAVAPAGIQANLYIAAFMMSYIFLVLVQLVEAGKTGENRTLYFGLACPATFFGALHGFFNAIIFLLPIARQTFGSAGSSVGFCLFSED